MSNLLINYYAVKRHLLLNEVIPLVYIGDQHFPGHPPMKLYNLKKPLGIHPIDSTVSEETILDSGYEIR